MTNHIFKSKYGIFKIRLRVSSELQPFFNRKEINKSLETKDYQEAINKAGYIISQYKQLLQLKENAMISDEQLQGLVGKYIIDVLNQDKLDRATQGFGTCYSSSDGTSFESDAEASIDALSGMISEYGKNLAECNYDDVIKLAKTLLSSIDIKFNNEESTHRLFLQTLMRAQIEIFTEAQARYKGYFNPKYDKPKTTTLTTKPKLKNDDNLTNIKALQLFLKTYKPSTSETQYKEVSGFLKDIFLPIVGATELVSDTTLEDMIELREILSKFPKRNIQKYRDMTIQEVFDSTPNDDELIGITTLNKYIKWCKLFYSFCMDNSYISKNPITSLTTSSDSDSLAERLPLASDEIAKLLAETSSDEILNNGIKVLAYSGMRLSEMYKVSINNYDGINCFDLSNRSIKLKTKNSYRLIPIHADINIALLSELPAKSTFSKKVNAIIRDKISSDEKKVLYSLRHSFATELKNKRVIHDVISELMGHSHQTMTFGRYASAYNVSILKEAIDKLNY